MRRAPAWRPPPWFTRIGHLRYYPGYVHEERTPAPSGHVPCRGGRRAAFRRYRWVIARALETGDLRVFV